MVEVQINNYLEVKQVKRGFHIGDEIGFDSEIKIPFDVVWFTQIGVDKIEDGRGLDEGTPLSFI